MYNIITSVYLQKKILWNMLYIDESNKTYDVDEFVFNK